MSSLSRKLAKMYWLWGILALAIIFFAVPQVFNQQMSIHGSEWKQGMCHTPSKECIIACGTNNFGTYSCITDRESSCNSDAGCEEVDTYSKSQTWGDTGYGSLLLDYQNTKTDTGKDIPKIVDPKGPSQTDIDLVTNDDGDTAAPGQLSCKSGKLYKGSDVWDECGSEGCTIKSGVPMCKSGVDNFITKKYGGVPVWMIALALLFLLLLAGLGRQNQ